MKPEFRETWTPAVNVLTWFMLVTSALSVLTRLGTKYWIFRKFTIDDFLSIGAMFTCIGESIAMSMATAGGFGQHLNTLSEVKKNYMMKALYASNILFIISMCCSKLAIMFFIRNLTPAALDRRFALGLGIFIVVWTVVGVFTAAFQCHVPIPWDYLQSQCFNRGAWWNFLGVTNILSEAGIIAQALLVVVRVQADIHKKAVLGSVFCLRIFVAIAIICQLVYASQTKSSADSSWDTWTVAVSTQMTQALSIITACSPQFKPVLDSLQSSGMGIGGSGYGSKNRTYGYGTSHKLSRGRTDRSETHELVTMSEVVITTDVYVQRESTEAINNWETRSD
ncbi:hypothetical protein N7520_011296 [Penicillium odoratum]|uniref:uncharacterized protein n=1 Tax=Penicillium odoratum TaxID=1167516 RepID=UPI00254775B2|nr:uncharacterized protein N7520_011296 [Penicillium odoratum]KAJ5746114.1 hypothetical protein N7520_011296 [Penicillium odoratum]